ncbi:MAG: hypothetical protein Q9219_004680 [cf. Caloplaca sp. 3 TL-2023]
MLSLVLLFSIITVKVLASPTPADDTPRRDVSILTGFQYKDCSADRVNILKQNINDAVALASAGLDEVRDELVDEKYPQWNHQQVDFSKQAAIDFFGPEKQNGPYQVFIFDAMLKAANAYPGWGFSDWWNSRYVQISCKDELNECGDTTPAYTANSVKKYKYPLVVFCPVFFTKLPSHSDVVAKIDKNKNLQQNLANMRSRATTFMHELLHISWGTAQECSGENACTDHPQKIGGKNVLSYKTGRAKLLAQRNVEDASKNNDNYVYYSMAKFMEKRWKQYPKYPTAWDPDKSRTDNENRDKKQPGAPSVLEALEGGSQNQAKEPTDDPVYSADQYPEWYKPLVTRNFEDKTPDVTQPSERGISYNGPENIEEGVVCETSDGSPDIQDCIHAFGSLRVSPQLGPLNGKKGGTWWAGYVNSCALAIYYKADWTDDCKATLKDVDDYALAIFEGCQNPGNGKVGGKADFKIDNCPAQIEIIKTDGQPPQGEPS